MSLLDVHIKNEYRSLIDNVVTDFYIPVLQESILYQRAVGFFSSSALIAIPEIIMTSPIGIIRIIDMITSKIRLMKRYAKLPDGLILLDIMEQLLILIGI